MNVKVFDDWKSYMHTAIGFIICFNPTWFEFGALIYLFYEIVESKNFSELIGDIFEFCFGAFVWHTVFCIWWMLTA